MVTTPTTQSALASLWYCRIYGLERGPITWEMLQDLAQAGDLKPSDLVRRADLDHWVVASQARCIQAMPESRPLPPRTDVDGTERLAAALAADAASAHAPARAFRRQEAAPAIVHAATSADHEKEDGTSATSIAAHSVVAAVNQQPRPSPQIVDTVDMASVEGSPDRPEMESAVVAAPVSPPDVESTPAPLPAAAVAKAVREARQSNPGGLALLALGLALIGLFKLALPLGLLSLYLGWQSASDMRRRPMGIGLAVAACALIVASVDVGVSLYTIVNRL